MFFFHIFFKMKKFIEKNFYLFIFAANSFPQTSLRKPAFFDNPHFGSFVGCGLFLRYAACFWGRTVASVTVKSSRVTSLCKPSRPLSQTDRRRENSRYITESAHGTLSRLHSGQKQNETVSTKAKLFSFLFLDAFSSAREHPSVVKLEETR